MLRHLRADRAAVVGRAGDELVLAHRHRRAVAAAAADQDLIGGDENTVTAYLALFSVAVGIGSALAALIARGRIVLDTTLAGAVLLGAVRARSRRCDAWRRAGRCAASRPRSRCFRLRSASAPRSISPASPSPAACSSCRPSPPCRPGPAPTIARARSPRVNVLNAAFMTGGDRRWSRRLQKFGVTVPMLFAGSARCAVGGSDLDGGRT